MPCYVFNYQPRRSSAMRTTLSVALGAPGCTTVSSLSTSGGSSACRWVDKGRQGAGLFRIGKGK
eukprot:4347879-Pleurochrysis_carterae.AAC.1